MSKVFDAMACMIIVYVVDSIWHEIVLDPSLRRMLDCPRDVAVRTNDVPNSEFGD